MEDNEKNTNQEIDQYWYMWSDVGIDLIRSGMRIRAASKNLQDIRDAFLQSLDRYRTYLLPEGANPALSTQRTPICLAFIMTPAKKKVLLQKVYTGQDIVGRYGAFFTHLVTNLPEDFEAEDAIALWRDPFWRSSDSGQPHGNTSLPFVEEKDLRKNADEKRDAELKRYKVPKDPEKLKRYHAQQERASRLQVNLHHLLVAYYLSRQTAAQSENGQTASMPEAKAKSAPFARRKKVETRQEMVGAKQQKIYIVGSCDDIACLIAYLVDCLPVQLARDLTFSTYEYDSVKATTDVVGICWVDPPVEPSTDEERAAYEEESSVHIQRLLPESYYQTELVVNCYTGRCSWRIKEELEKYNNNIVLHAGYIVKPEYYWLADRIHWLRIGYEYRNIDDFIERYKEYHPVKELVANFQKITEPLYQEELVNLAIYRWAEYAKYFENESKRAGNESHFAEMSAKAFYKVSYIVLEIIGINQYSMYYKTQDKDWFDRLCYARKEFDDASVTAEMIGKECSTSIGTSIKEFEAAIKIARVALPDSVPEKEAVLCEDAITDVVLRIPPFFHRYWDVYARLMEVWPKTGALYARRVPLFFHILWIDLDKFVKLEQRLGVPMQWVTAIIWEMCESQPKMSKDDVEHLEGYAQSSIELLEKQLVASAKAGSQATKCSLRETDEWKTLIKLLEVLRMSGYTGKEPSDERHA